MHKSIFRIALVIILSFSAACSEDFLELDNKNALTDGSFYQTQEDFLMALNSLYTPLAHSGGFGLQMQLIFGSFEDRILFETPGMDRLVAISPSSGNVSTYWRDLYMGMYRTNMFIRRLNERQNVTGLTSAMRTSYMAQARALRAAYMFYLVTIFNAPPFMMISPFRKILMNPPEMGIQSNSGI
jgi:starch-binding outer membrane protein, SusD/RagB family